MLIMQRPCRKTWQPHHLVCVCIISIYAHTSIQKKATKKRKWELRLRYTSTWDTQCPGVSLHSFHIFSTSRIIYVIMTVSINTFMLQSWLYKIMHQSFWSIQPIHAHTTVPQFFFQNTKSTSCSAIPCTAHKNLPLTTVNKMLWLFSKHITQF